MEAGGVGAFGFDHPGIDRVHADLLGPKLARQHAGDGVDCALGSGVDGGGCGCDAADNGADVDDAAALADVLEGCLRGEQQAEHIDVEDPVELLFGNRLNRGELVDAGVVDQNVEPAVVFDGCVDNPLRPRRPWKRHPSRRQRCHRLP